MKQTNHLFALSELAVEQWPGEAFFRWSGPHDIIFES